VVVDGAWLSFSLLVTWAWPRVIARSSTSSRPSRTSPARAHRRPARPLRFPRQGGLRDGRLASLVPRQRLFTGLGREKRIVFFDTLLSSLNAAQVESVLAHELAHFKLRHIPQRLCRRRDEPRGFALLAGCHGRSGLHSARRSSRERCRCAPAFHDRRARVHLGGVARACAWSRRHEYEATHLPLSTVTRDRWPSPGDALQGQRHHAYTGPAVLGVPRFAPAPGSRIERLRALGAPVAATP